MLASLFLPSSIKHNIFNIIFTLALVIMFVFFSIRTSMHISYILMLISLIIYTFFRPKKYRLNTDIKLLLLSFAIYALASLPPLFLNHGWEGSLRFQEAFLKFFLYGFILFLVFKFNINIVSNILFPCIFIGSIITCLCAIYMNIAYHETRINLANGVFQFAYFLAIISIIALNLLLSPITKIIKNLAFIALSLCFLCLLINASRGIILGFIAALIFSILIHLAHHNLKYILKKIFTPILISITLFALIPSFHSFLNIKTKQIESETSNFDGTQQETSIGYRFKIWDNGIAMWKLSPIFGMNPKTRIEKKEEITATSQFKIPINNDEHIGESHNESINALAKNGLVGLFALWFLYFICTYIFITKLRENNYLWSSMGLSVLILYITDGCFNTPLDSKIEAPLFCFCLMIFYNLFLQTKNRL